MSHLTNKNTNQDIPRKERERLRHRNEMITAAITLFVEKGFANTKLEDVAQLAEFGKGTIYNYFENKQDLLVSSLVYVFDHLLVYLQEKLKDVDKPLDRIRLMVNSQFNHFQEHQDFLHPQQLNAY